MLRISAYFPLGVYHAQDASDFAVAEWPPHPVRLLAALKAAAHGSADTHDIELGCGLVGRLASARPPVIVAPTAASLAAADGTTRVARLRGASRWAPRNHEMSELKGGKGITPRDLGRSRAEVHKVGVAVGDMPVSFVWGDVDLADDDMTQLVRLAAAVTFLGTSRSPVLLSVSTEPARDEMSAWRPVSRRRATSVQVRVPDSVLPEVLDAWHARRAAAPKRDGTPAPAPYVAPAALGRFQAYDHDTHPAPQADFEPRWWDEPLVLAIDREASDAVPRASVAFTLARATRAALLATYGAAGGPDEAPEVLFARGATPHVALVPLHWVEPENSATARYADGRTLGLAVVLPHRERRPDYASQRRAVEDGLRRLVLDDPPRPVRVPGVGAVILRPLPATPRIRETLRAQRYTTAARRWASVTPVVHSRYQARRGERGLLEQVAADCADVGLPVPETVEVLRRSRFRGAPAFINAKQAPRSDKALLAGPHSHLELTFEQPVEGPVLLGRARHFGLGLCLPLREPEGEDPR